MEAVRPHSWLKAKSAPWRRMRVSIRRPEDDLVGPCDARGRSRFPPHASLAPPVFSKPRDASNDCPDVVRGNEPRALELPWRAGVVPPLPWHSSLVGRLLELRLQEIRRDALKYRLRLASSQLERPAYTICPVHGDPFPRGRDSMRRTEVQNGVRMLKFRDVFASSG